MARAAAKAVKATSALPPPPPPPPPSPLISSRGAPRVSGPFVPPGCPWRACHGRRLPGRWGSGGG